MWGIITFIVCLLNQPFIFFSILPSNSVRGGAGKVHTRPDEHSMFCLDYIFILGNASTMYEYLIVNSSTKMNYEFDDKLKTQNFKFW